MMPLAASSPAPHNSQQSVSTHTQAHSCHYARRVVLWTSWNAPVLQAVCIRSTALTSLARNSVNIITSFRIPPQACEHEHRTLPLRAADNCYTATADTCRSPCSTQATSELTHSSPTRSRTDTPALLAQALQSP